MVIDVLVSPSTIIILRIVVETSLSISITNVLGDASDVQLPRGVTKLIIKFSFSILGLPTLNGQEPDSYNPKNKISVETKSTSGICFF